MIHIIIGLTNELKYLNDDYDNDVDHDNADEDEERFLFFCSIFRFFAIHPVCNILIAI